jgi:hypothetical protein
MAEQGHMTRDETVALFLECEAKRAEAMAAALAQGMFEEEAEALAHDAAKARWNTWAKIAIDRRRTLEERGKFVLLSRRFRETRRQWRSHHSEDVQEWLDFARADFSRTRFSATTTRVGERDWLEEGIGGQHFTAKLNCSGYWIDFHGFIFPGEADFSDAEFRSFAAFDDADFRGPAWFHKLDAADMRFKNAVFQEDVVFRGASLRHNVAFENAQFEKEADFEAVEVRRGFYLDQAKFTRVPNFIQTHFEEAPRLDNFVIRSHSSNRGPEVSAYWRALKRLAIQGNDTDRELEFFSQEIRSARFAGDWPLPWPFWKTNAWGGFLRFWAGLLYQILSNFGRSLLRPFLAWALCIVIFAAYFLGQSPEMAAKRKELHRGGVYGQAIAYSSVALGAVTQRHPPGCLSEETEKNFAEKRLEVDAQGNGFSPLMKQVRSQTNLVNEALSIAYHNGVILLDSSGDSAHRAFGCLYGVERYGGNPVAYVPRSVGIESGIQKLLSAVFIFLFGLAVRNMLKVK